MIHALIWLAHLTSPKFVWGIVFFLAIAIYLYGPIGLSIAAVLFVGDLGFWLVPRGFAPALSLFGLSALIVGAAVGAITLFLHLTRRSMTGYEKAVKSGDTSKWWKPTPWEKLTGGRHPKPWDDVRDGGGKTIVTDEDRRRAAAGPAPRRYPSTAGRRRAASSRATRRGMAPADDDDGT